MLERESIVATWRWLAGRQEGTVRECGEATGLAYETVRGAFRVLLEGGLARASAQKPLRISLKESDLNRHLRSYFHESPKRATVTLSAAAFVKLYAQPSEVEEILYSEKEPVAVRGVKRNIRTRGPVKVIEVMEEQVTPETVFLKEVQSADGVEDLCIQLLAGYPMDFAQLLRLSNEKAMVNLVGCYLDILSDLNGDLVKREHAEGFRRSVSHRTTPVFLESERDFGKEGWEEPYENRWHVDLFLDLGAIEHGVRAVS